MKQSIWQGCEVTITIMLALKSREVIGLLEFGMNSETIIWPDHG
tara:strand:- start:151 stop:282 length:132 start_codon:yes stop_codon:yes gene_type:complete